MKITLYLDEDSQDNDLLRALRSRAVDVIPATEAGMLERSDEDQLECAVQQGRVLYSFNARDFYRLHTLFLSEGKSHGGIIRHAVVCPATWRIGSWSN